LPIPPPNDDEEIRSNDSDESLPSAIQQTVWKTIRTVCNSFGLFREYPSLPSHNPDDIISTQDLTDAPLPPTNDPGPSNAAFRNGPPLAKDPASGKETPSYLPFKNSTTYGLMDWMWSGSAMKSIGEVTRLVDFLKSDEFNKEDLKGFDLRSETAKYDKFLESRDVPEDGVPSSPRDGWKESEIIIEVPDGKPHTANNIPTFTVPGLHHRSFVEVLKSAVADVSARSWHYVPFRSLWSTPTSSDQPQPPPQRVYDEIFSSDAMFEAHKKLQEQPPEPGCTLERVVLSLMFWSDSTHLANFGTMSLWPLYLFFGNQSKWTRGKPRTDSCHHMAYIPKVSNNHRNKLQTHHRQQLPDSFHDFYVGLTGDGPSADVLTHCRRGLMHAVWHCLLDEDFLHAYEHGIVIMCPDGVLRRFYPRFFTYSADYPEK